MLKRNKLSALMLSAIGVLSMTACLLTSCEDDPDPIDPTPEKVTEIVSEHFVEFDDDYIYPAETSKYFAPYIVRSAYFDDESMPVIDFISSKDKALMKSGESAKLYCYAVQDDFSAFGTLVVDSNGEESNDVVISEDGDITCPTVTSRKDYTIYLIAGEDEESVKTGNGSIYKAIYLTVVPENQFASTDYVDYMSKGTSEREAMSAQLEKYMYTAGLASVANMNNGSYQLYSDRVRGPFIDENLYIPGYGYGILTYSMLEKDLESEQVAEWKRFYHTLIDSTYDEGNFNYLGSNSGNVSEFYSYISSGYYNTLVNADESGSEYQNCLAREAPIAINPDSDGASDTWKIKLKVGGATTDESKGIYKGLSYRTATTNATLARFDKTDIKLEDYLTPFKLLATGAVGWYRGEEQAAESTANRQLTNFSEFYSATKNSKSLPTEQELIDFGFGATLDRTDNSITLKFNGKIAPDYAEYQLDSLWSNPISEEFITALGDGNALQGAENYGKNKGNLSPLDTILSVGPYYTSHYESKKVVTFSKNEEWPITKDDHDRPLYRIAGVHILIDAAISTNTNEYIEKFEAGLTDVSNIPTDKWADYETDSRRKKVDGSSLSQTFINTWDYAFWNQRFAETIKNGKTNWEVKPCLSNENFYKGLLIGVNRNAFADYYHMNPDFTIQEPINKASPKAGVYNGTQVHKDAVEESFDGKMGDYANWKVNGAEYFEAAIEEELAAGHYQLGTEDKPTVFGFTIVMPENVESQERDWNMQNDYWREAFNLAVTTHVDKDGKKEWLGPNGKQLITFNAGTEKVSNADSTAMQNTMLYNGVKIGNYDGQGYWYVSGNNYDVLNNLEKYKSNDSSGFTLNYGADTSVPSADIYYNGKYWSFDALWDAANSGTFLDEKGKSIQPLEFDYDNEVISGTKTLVKLELPIKYLEDYIDPDSFEISVYSWNSATEKIVSTKRNDWTFENNVLKINFTGSEIMDGLIVGSSYRGYKYFKLSLKFVIDVNGQQTTKTVYFEDVSQL